MRIIFFMLLLANVFVLAFNFFAGAPPRTTALPEEINGDKVRILAPEEHAPADPVPAPATGEAPAATASNEAACLAWGVFQDATTVKARERLAALNLQDRLKEKTTQIGVRVMVYLAPSANPEDAEKKLTALKALKIGDARIVHDEGKWHNAISLGIFSSEESALRHKDQLVGKGVKGLKTANYGTAPKQTLFIVRNPSDQEASSLTALSTEFAGTELKAITCGEG